MEQTNWEQVRIQAAIAAMQGILANRYADGYYTCGYCTKPNLISDTETARHAVKYADALIEELKKEKQ